MKTEIDTTLRDFMIVLLLFIAFRIESYLGGGTAIGYILGVSCIIFVFITLFRVAKK